MERKGRIASPAFFLTVLCVYCIVDPVKASIINKYRYRGRSIQEQALTGQADLCADIVGPEWNVTKQEESPCPTLVVWVPKKPGFTEFVKVNEHNEVEGGFSIAILCHALHLLPFNVRPIFKPFVNEKGEMNGTYDQMLQHMESQGRCNLVAGDVTIRGNRTQYVSFTTPYLSAEIYMLVHAAHQWNQTLWTFLKPFSSGLWIALVCACILIGIVVGFLEYRAGNPQFASPFQKQLVMVMWFPISTFFFHEGRIRNRSSKVVLVMWLCMIFIVLQIFTATLSSWLTLDQLRPKLPSTLENVGYKNGSFVKDFIMQNHNCTGKNLLALNSYEEFKKALTNGSVNAIIAQLPYVDIFLAKYGSKKFMKFGPIHQAAGIAFALPKKTEYLEIFSRAVANVIESEVMNEMKKTYLGLSTPPDEEQPNEALPERLDFKCFIGLFIFMGVVTLAAITVSEISFTHRDIRIGIEEEEHKEQASKFEQVKIQIPN